MSSFIFIIANRLFIAPSVFLLNTLVIIPTAYIVHLFTLPPRYILAYLSAFLFIILDIIKSFETIYIFLGSAVCIGSLTGLGLYLTSYGLTVLLHITPEDEKKPVIKARTAATRRQERLRLKKPSVEEVAVRGLNVDDHFSAIALGLPRGPLTTQTIPEEDEDSDMS